MRQAQALYLMEKGESVFLTGPAGSGKTFVLNQFIRLLKKKKKQVAVTASTGIAATHIGGTTIHSWSGLGIREALQPQDEAYLKNNAKLQKRYNAADVLIIDEISMLHGARLDMVNQACKLLRGSEQPFGGLQVILTGDLFQLPPVSRGGAAVDFAHQSGAWQELNPTICYLSEQHRQGDDALLGILQAMRSQGIEDYHAETLRERLNVTPSQLTGVTRLFSHNVDVDSINQTKLDSIDSATKRYKMETKGRARYVESLQKSVLAPETLELKIGAEVMFVANNFSLGFSNGTRGQIVAFNDEGAPLIKLQAKNRVIAAAPHTWSVTEDGAIRAEVTQLPLRLAWAITIHKSQGMSLDSALIDLSRSFTPGMGYVALSRVRSLSGLYLVGINSMAMRLHPDIYEFDRQLQRDSSARAVNTPDYQEKIYDNQEEVLQEIDKDLFAELKAWRLQRARHDQVPPFIIAHNTLLEELSRSRPVTPQKLVATKGFGAKKLETYGDELLEILRHDAKIKDNEKE